MSMHRHVAAEESRQITEFVVVHFGIAVALVVDLTDVDVGDRLTIDHRWILFFIGVLAVQGFSSCTGFRRLTTAERFCHA
ncbi:hypothetical protein D3C86_1845130 [compost metagenome]